MLVQSALIADADGMAIEAYDVGTELPGAYKPKSGKTNHIIKESSESRISYKGYVN